MKKSAHDKQIIKRIKNKAQQVIDFAEPRRDKENDINVGPDKEKK
jgi:hypothetical protein